MTGNRAFNNKDIDKYALFAAGIDATNAALANYDPLVTGFGRLFMVRKPLFLDTYFGDGPELKTFKHILEYGNTGVSGINGIDVEFDSLAGGYSGLSMDIPTKMSDNTNSFTVGVYEFTGSPVRSVLHTWISGVVDRSGISHYQGVELPVLAANHTAEFIYVVTDRSGKEVEFACMLANCFPKGVKEDHFAYEAGSHDLVKTDVEFACVKYESLAINEYAKILLNKYRILSNSLNLNPRLKDQIGASGEKLSASPIDAYTAAAPAASGAEIISSSNA